MKLRLLLFVILLISTMPLCTAKGPQDIILRKADATPSRTTLRTNPSEPTQEEPTEQEGTAEEAPKPLTEEEQLEIFERMNLPKTEHMAEIE